MPDETKEELKAQLIVLEAMKEERRENRILFADKWVELAAKWLIVLLAGSVVVTAGKMAVDFLFTLFKAVH